MKRHYARQHRRYQAPSVGRRWLRLQQVNRNSANCEFVSEMLNGRLPLMEVEFYASV